MLSVVLAIGGCATGAVQKSQTREAPWMQVATARMRSDHEALAAWHAQEAESATERAAAHRKIRDSYASLPGLFSGAGMVGHCTNLVHQNEQAAKESAALAEMHRRIANEAKE